MAFPLDGLRCIELSERGSAAYAGKLLHRLGADLTKVESSAGDPLRYRASRRHEVGGRSTTPAYDFFNEGKLSVVSDAAGLRQQLVGADAFVLDLELWRYAAWDLVPEELRALGVSVVCAITPFGWSGPYRDFHGPEVVTTSYGGMNVGIGEPGRPPLKMPFMQTALQAGVVASIALMGALYGHRPGDPPVVIEISETDVWATVHAGTTMVSFLFSNRLRKRTGRRVLGQPYPHQLFRCKDGWIAVQASERHQFEQFVAMVGSPDWLRDRRFGSRMEMNEKYADQVDRLLDSWFRSRTRAEIFAECRARKIPAAPVRTVAEVREDPDLAARNAFETFTGGTGVSVTVPAPPFKFRTAEVRPPKAVQPLRVQRS